MVKGLRSCGVTTASITWAAQLAATAETISNSSATQRERGDRTLKACDGTRENAVGAVIIVGESIANRVSQYSTAQSRVATSNVLAENIRASNSRGNIAASEIHSHRRLDERVRSQDAKRELSDGTNVES